MNKLPRTLFLIAILSCAILVLCWFLIARPIFPVKGSTHMTISPDRLKIHVEKLSQEFSPRSYADLENLNRTADYIKDEFTKSGARVTEQAYMADGHEYRNIIAEYGPESAEIVVVGAHYDAAGQTPGADDNASGIAGLIELGRALSKETLNSRVVLAAYTLEEPPYFATANMGSAVHAKSLKDGNVPVKLMISLEMIGYFTDEKGSQAFPMPLLKLFYPAKGNFIAIVDQVFSDEARKMKRAVRMTTGMPVHSLNAPAFVTGVDFSDHRNFWRNGYPAVMVTDTAFLRNTAYHTANDTADRLDYEKMAHVVHGVHRYVRRLAGGS